MARKYFGTDGIRGTVNADKMTIETAMRVGLAAGRHFMRGDHRHRVVIGKDTRLSGYMIEPALVAGFVAAGMDVTTTGPLPTPAIAMLTKSLRCDLGVMISASHNPYEDNGIKLFGPDGHKLSDEVEAEIEAKMDNGLAQGFADPSGTGCVVKLEDVRGRYNEFLKNTVPSGFSLSGLKIVLDCAHGAAYKVGPWMLWELGAEVIKIGVEPNGTNINQDCGSTHPEYMCEQVIAHGADIGIALDGDADRLIVADEKGRVIDGDQLMALIARNWLEAGLLKGGGIVTTVMSNLGLERYLAELDLELVRTQVGDRYVMAHMREHGFNFGGEQSGHLIFSDFSTTGDGLIAALQIMRVLKADGRPASEVLNVFRPLPQVLKNVRYGDTDPLLDKKVVAAIEAGENSLEGSGRLLIRKSGTEPLVRVMAEGDDAALVERVVNEICATVEDAA
ncbi:MAG: phosphoglucosamine mutase [Proteobacteria bacterium]|nr:phosphoglucosamine mutase [Pseudomonadota bacterium]